MVAGMAAAVRRVFLVDIEDEWLVCDHQDAGNNNNSPHWPVTRCMISTLFLFLCWVRRILVRLDVVLQQR